ncbi:hypothetical protein IAT40_000672 [Kwoniella sp. CBS 6097]
MQASTSALPVPANAGSSSTAHYQHYPDEPFNLPTVPEVPRQCLTTEEAVSKWQASTGFQRFWSWIKWRSERIKGKDILRGPYTGDNEGIKTLLDMLEKMSGWVEEVPPQPQSNQRFGNLAFRTYIKLVEERLPKLFTSPTIPSHLVDQLLPLLLDSHAFGHPIRIDYGTGHELAFVLALYVCTIPGWIGGMCDGGDRGEEEAKQAEEDELISRVFPRYLDLTTQLQKTYRLEPAGSHGVWGLDDYCFLPYLFGSAQLLDSATSPTQALQSAVSRRSRTGSSSGSSSIPATSNADNDETDRDKDMYTLSLTHLLIFKHGASFSEHSPLLYNLSTMKDWTKIHGGLKKMFLGEVVGKRVVVQGLFVGGWTWGEGLPESSGARDVRGNEASTSGQPNPKKSARNGQGVVGSGAVPGMGMGGNPVTKAPWAR